MIGVLDFEVKGSRVKYGGSISDFEVLGSNV